MANVDNSRVAAAVLSKAPGNDDRYKYWIRFGVDILQKGGRVGGCHATISTYSSVDVFPETTCITCERRECATSVQHEAAQEVLCGGAGVVSRGCKVHRIVFLGGERQMHPRAALPIG